MNKKRVGRETIRNKYEIREIICMNKDMKIKAHVIYFARNCHR